MGDLRSTTMLARYRERLASIKHDTDCKLCILPIIKSFTYWNIVPNEYPYDLIAETHHMLQPKRHCTALELTTAERDELHTIKFEYLQHHYDFVSESLPHTSSIPEHHHLHLIKIHDHIGTP